jgi:ubiquinone/menaquinone biosynthesis C-methylase UbiE
MNWHETIEYIRKEPSFQELVRDAYLSGDLKLNVESFRNSDEFKETLKLLFSLNIDKNATLLDVGAGNGISTIAFALEGFKVSALEPDISDTVGAGAILKLKEIYCLNNINVVTSFGEEMPFPDNYFDIVYARQCMHHAFDLNKFTKSIYRVVKSHGLLLTVRDHVVSNEVDKQAFLKIHPLQKFYGGENAFTLDEYKNAISDAGFKIKKIFNTSSSVINYAPLNIKMIKDLLIKKLGTWAVNSLFIKLAWWRIKFKLNKSPGRMYTFIAEK